MYIFSMFYYFFNNSDVMGKTIKEVHKNIYMKLTFFFSQAPVWFGTAF